MKRNFLELKNNLFSNAKIRKTWRTSEINEITFRRVKDSITTTRDAIDLNERVWIQKEGKRNHVG